MARADALTHESFTVSTLTPAEEQLAEALRVAVPGVREALENGAAAGLWGRVPGACAAAKAFLDAWSHLGREVTARTGQELLDLIEGDRWLPLIEEALGRATRGILVIGPDVGNTRKRERAWAAACRAYQRAGNAIEPLGTTLVAMLTHRKFWSEYGVLPLADVLRRAQAREPGGPGAGRAFAHADC